MTADAAAQWQIVFMLLVLGFIGWYAVRALWEFGVRGYNNREVMYEKLRRLQKSARARLTTAKVVNVPPEYILVVQRSDGTYSIHDRSGVVVLGCMPVVGERGPGGAGD